MNKYMGKKFIAITLSSFLAFITFGCGDSTSENGDMNNVYGSGDSVYWYSTVSGWGPGNWEGTETNPLLETIEENFGITFNIEQPPTDAETKLGLMIASDELPDMISVTDADLIKELIASDKVWDLQSFLEEYDPDSHLLTDFPEDVKNALVSTYGGWYSYPSHIFSEDNRTNYPPCDETYVDLTYKASNMSIMFNKTMMDELGITEEMVQTESGFYEACEIVKNSGYTVDGQSVIPVMLHADSWIEQSLDTAIASNFGVSPVDENGDYRSIELSPGYKNALKFVNNCVQNGFLDINYLTIDEAAMKTYVESGRVFCWIGNCAQSSTKEEIPWVSYGTIVPDNGAVAVLGVNSNTGTGWIQTFISKDCENPEAIAQMLSFVSSEEGMFLNEYGIEGVDYTLEDGIVTRTEEGLETYVNTYNSNMWLWPFNNTDFARSVEKPAEEGTDGYIFNQVATAMGKKDTTYIYDSGLTAFTSGTVIDPTSDLGIEESQIKSYLESQKAKIISATSDEEFETEYDNMISEMEKYDIYEIDAEYNKVLEENESIYGTTIEDVNASLYE